MVGFTTPTFLYITENTVIIIPRGSFTKEINSFQSIEQRNNSSNEETLKQCIKKEKIRIKSLKNDWLKLYRIQIRSSNPVENPG